MVYISTKIWVIDSNAKWLYTHYPFSILAFLISLSSCLCFLPSVSHSLRLPQRSNYQRLFPLWYTAGANNKEMGKRGAKYERTYFKGTAHQSDLAGSWEILLNYAGVASFSLHLLAQTTTQGGLKNGRYFIVQAASFCASWGERQIHTRCYIFYFD